MNNKESFKRILKFTAAFICIFAFSACFRVVWHEYYNSEMLDPFWHNGNIMMICIYAVIYIAFSKCFSAFRIGYYKWSGLLGSQVLSILSANIVTYLEISLIVRGRMGPLPILIMTVTQILFAAIWSFLFTRLYAKIYPPKRMIVVYGNVNAGELVKKMSNRPDKYIICASISCNEDLDYIKEQISKYEAVIISDVPNNLRNKLIKFTLENSIRTYINPKLSDIILRGAEDFHLFDTPLLLSRNDGPTLEQSFLKRFFDITFSFIALAVASPFLLITAVAIKCYDGGPVFYSQERLTTNGKIFKVHKFRSMIVNAEKDGVARLASQKDDRITPVGKFIRKIRFDELPQLINILKGEMSFVGPRPERPELAKKYCETMPEFNYRLKVKAGLTGYAQVMGKYNTTPYDKLKLDLMYIEHQSLLLDLKIILMTIKTCFVPEATEGVKEQPIETHRQESTEKDKVLTR